MCDHEQQIARHLYVFGQNYSDTMMVHVIRTSAVECIITLISNVFIKGALIFLITDKINRMTYYISVV